MFSALIIVYYLKKNDWDNLCETCASKELTFKSEAASKNWIQIESQMNQTADVFA